MCSKDIYFFIVLHVMDTFDQESYNAALWSLLDDLRNDKPKDSESNIQTPSPITNSEQIKNTTPLPDTTPVCENCGIVGELDHDDGNYVCKKCFTVQSRVIDSGAEWRYYGPDDGKGTDPNRCGMPTNDLLPQSSLGSMIGGSWNDSKTVRKIRMYQMWNAMPYWERTLADVFEKIMNNTSTYGISSKIVDDAKVMYKQVSEKKISRGDNREGLIASSIYYACLINNVPRTVEEVSEMFHIEPIVLKRGNARFQSMLKLNVKCSNAQDFVARFGTNLGMDWQDIDYCKQIASRLDELDVITENAPTSIAAATIFYWSQKRDLELSKKQIAEVSKVSDPTISKCYKKITKWKEYISDIGEDKTSQSK